MDGKITYPEQVYTGKVPNITYMRIQGNKAYSYINPKMLYKDNKHDKLILKGKKKIYIKILFNTIKYLKIYALDLGYIMLNSRLFVDKLIVGGIINLRLRNYISRL